MYTEQKTKATIARGNPLLLTICVCACPYLPYMQLAPLLIKCLLLLFKGLNFTCLYVCALLGHIAIHKHGANKIFNFISKHTQVLK